MSEDSNDYTISQELIPEGVESTRRALALARSQQKRLKAAERDRNAKADKARATAKAEKTKVRNRARNTANQRARRERIRMAECADLPALLADIEMGPLGVDPQTKAAEEAALAAWLDKPGREQGALRRKEREAPGELMLARCALLVARAELGQPSWQNFADRLASATGRPWSREQARRQHAILEKLEGPTGPWHGR